MLILAALVSTWRNKRTEKRRVEAGVIRDKAAEPGRPGAKSISATHKFSLRLGWRENELPLPLAVRKRPRASRRAVSRLRERGLSVRYVGAILDLSPQRISQLAAQSR